MRIQADTKVCAEPPPDAAAQFAATFAANLSAPIKGQSLDTSAQADMAMSMRQLFRRSQDVQFYRDGLFALCNLYMNDGISKAQYIEELRALSTTAATLIQYEIPYLDKSSFYPMGSPNMPAAGNGNSATQ